MVQSTHGTHEFYAHRAAITRELIDKKGFSVVLVEGDWPAAWRLNRYVTSAGSTDASAEQALCGFEGFPRWMWRNSVVAELAEWLRARNARVAASGKERSEELATLEAMRAAGASEPTAGGEVK